MEHENQKINKLIMQGWTIICTVLFLAYALEVVKHNRTIPYFAIFAALDLVPLLATWGIYRKNNDSNRIPYLCVVFYGVLYVFVLLTGATPMTFSYILPMLYLLMLTNNPKLIGWAAIGTVIANVLSIIIQAMIEHKPVSDYLTDWEIQFAAAVLCAIFSYLAIRVSAFLYEQRIEMIQADEERLKNFFEKVADVSATVEVDSREMLERLVRLEESSDKTSFAMNEIVSGSTQSAEMVECQLQMTADIQNVIDQTNDVTNNMGNQVAETSEKVSTGIENMRKLFASASDVERNSSQVMEHMNLLQETTEQVEDIISIINGIASQTNLLALNASIEAARAGEAGRGFAVVADEINGLANQTKEATQNIAQMVTTLREKASEAAVSVKKMTEMNQIQNELIGDTDRAFGEIQKGMSFVLKDTERETEQMKNLMAANAQIVESIHTISAVSEEVMANTNQTQTITDENRMVVKQVTELAKMLGQKVAELNSYI